VRCYFAEKNANIILFMQYNNNLDNNNPVMHSMLVKNKTTQYFK